MHAKLYNAKHHLETVLINFIHQKIEEQKKQLYEINFRVFGRPEVHVCAQRRPDSS